MRVWNSAVSWGWPARVIHWVMAFAILGMLGLGLYTANVLEDLQQRFELVQIHKSIGFLLFFLALIRVLWRLCNRRSPGLPVSMKPWERRAASMSHGALYVLIIAMPVSGWLMASASRLKDDLGVPNMVFGLFEMPDPFVPGDTGLSEAFATVHFGCAVALILLLAVHVAAGFKHHFFHRDDVLKRMTFGP